MVEEAKETDSQEPVKEEAKVAESVKEEAEEAEESVTEPAKKRRGTYTSRGESYWTAKELADKLGCGHTWIYEQIKKGKIKAIRQGRHVKISPDEALRVLKEGLPLPPKPEPETDAREVIVEGKHVERVQPPVEPKVEPDEEKGDPGWPLNIFFR